MQRFMLKIEHQDDVKLDNEQICCYLVDENTVSYVEKTDKLVLSYGENAGALCKKDNLDGVVCELDDSQSLKKQVTDLRTLIGKNKFLGIISPLTRHDAMLVSECEPDFIAFRATNEQKDEAIDLINWYNDFFLIQAAIVVDDKIEDCKVFDTEFVLLNRDFLKEISC